MSNATDDERDAKRLANIESMAASDKSYKETKSYQDTKAELSGDSRSSQSSGSGAYTGEYGKDPTPYEQQQSGTGTIGKAHVAVTERGEYASVEEAGIVAQAAAHDQPPPVTQVEHGIQQTASHGIVIDGMEYQHEYETIVVDGAEQEVPVLARYNEEGQRITRYAHQPDVAASVLGEGVERGYIHEQVQITDSGEVIRSYSFIAGTPETVKQAMLTRFGETGYTVIESPVDNRLVFTERKYGTTTTPTRGELQFDFATNTYTDTATGEVFKHELPKTAVAQQVGMGGGVQPTQYVLPPDASPTQAVQLASLAHQETKAKYDANVSLGKVEKQPFSLATPYFGHGLKITAPGKQTVPKTKSEVDAELAEGEWISFQDVFKSLAAGSFYVPRGDEKEGQMLTRITAKYKEKGISVEAVGYDLSERFAWKEKIPLGQERMTRAFGGASAVEGDYTASIAGSAAYFALQVPYLFADTAFTIMTVGKITQATATAPTIFAKQGLAGGAKTIITGVASEASKAAGTPTYLLTGLIKQIPPAQKMQIAQTTGALVLAAAGARATGITKEGTPIGDFGQGVVDTSGKFVRYVTLKSKPGEREDVVASATIFNMPYYGAKLINIRPTGLMSKGVEVIYRGANIAAAGLITYKHVQAVEEETGAPNYAKAFGRSYGEIVIFEYMFEQATVDTMFEQSSIYKGSQAKLGALQAQGKIKPEYGTYWSGIEGTPTVKVDFGGIKGMSYDIKPTTPRPFVEMEGFAIKPAPSADFGGKGVTAKHDFIADVRLEPRAEQEYDFVPTSRIEMKPDQRVYMEPDTKFDIGKLDMGRIDMRLDMRADDKFDPMLEPRLEHRLDFKLEPTIEARLEPRFDDPAKVDDPTKVEDRLDTKIETKIDIFDPLVLGAAFLPFLGGGGGGGRKGAYGTRVKARGEAYDLMSIYLGETPKQQRVQRVPRQPTKKQPDILMQLAGKKRR